MTRADRRMGGRSQLRSVLRVADDHFTIKLAALVFTSLVLAGLDAIGILLLLPLVELLSEPSGTQSIQVPLLGGMTAEALAAGVVILFISKSAGSMVVRWWSTGVVATASANTSTKLFDAYLQAPLEYHDDRNSAQSVRTTTLTVEEMYEKAFLGGVTAIAEAIALVMIAALVLFISPLSGLVGVLYFGLTSLAYLRYFQPRTKYRAVRSQQLNSDAIQTVQESLGGLREHRVRGSAGAITKYYGRQRHEYANHRRFMTFATEMPRYYLEILFVGGFGVVALTVFSTDDSDSSLLSLSLLLGAGFRILPAISRLLNSLSNVRRGTAALEVVLAELDQLQIVKLRDHMELPASKGPLSSSSTPIEIELDNVRFRYRNAEADTLVDVSIKIPAGTSLGIVGPSGAGKSTLIDLICGVRSPRSGVILIDGVPLVEVVDVWRKCLGLVPQSVYLLDSTIRENVSFGLAVDDARVWEALERASLADYVRSMPAGLDTVVGESGTRLSGGQRQRLGIARALCGRPAVLILDEATAALDVETETTIVHAIEALKQDVSVIVVAHRLSTIRNCDSIMYLEKGRVISSGTLTKVAQLVPQFASALQSVGLANGISVEEPVVPNASSGS